MLPASEAYLDFSSASGTVSDVVPPPLQAAVSPQDWKAFVDEVNRPLEGYFAFANRCRPVVCLLWVLVPLTFFAVPLIMRSEDMPFTFGEDISFTFIPILIIALICILGCWDSRKKQAVIAEISEACQRASSRSYGVTFGIKHVPVQHWGKKGVRTMMMPAITVAAGDVAITVGNKMPPPLFMPPMGGMQMMMMPPGGAAMAPPPLGFPGMAPPPGGGMGLPPPAFPMGFPPPVSAPGGGVEAPNFCPACGAPSNGNSFCGSCGKPLRS